MVKLDFNLSDVPDDDFAPLPEDDYNVMIIDECIKENSKGTGSYLQLDLVVVDGECKGRKIWDRLNLWNPNPEACKIAQKTLTAITRAVGLDVATLDDTAALHNLPLSAKVVIGQYTVTKDGEREERKNNKIKSYSPKKAAQAAPATTDDDTAPF